MKFRKALKFFLVFTTITAWAFSSWPRIYNLPPKIQEASAALNDATVEVLGGGGGGGFASGLGGGGGGGGEYRRCTETLSVQSYTVTVGVGGTINTAGETDSTFSGTGITMTADGGNGSGIGVITAGTAGTGGVSTNCDTAVANFDGGTAGAGTAGTADSAGGGGGGGGYGGKGGNGATTASSKGGGGGGGGGYTAPPVVTRANFSGRAYPKSIVTLLKDAQISATTIAGTDANFQLSVSGLASGNYIFSVYSEDSKGVRSSLLTFPVSVTSGATTNVSGIFITPTIAVDKSEVKRGDNVAIFGQSSPQSDIVISVSSEEEFFGKTISDKDGVYLYNFDTSLLDYGTHDTKSKASIGNQLVSGWSNLVGFKVGTKNIPAQPPTQSLMKGDLNNDRNVNLIDFSIAAYWYKRPSPPSSADLNSDGKVDLIDFSIMAYNWTG